MIDQLLSYGWNEHFERELASGETHAHMARVVQEHKEAYLVRAAGAGMGNIWAEISGKMRHHGAVRADYPAVGDWVVLRGLDHAIKDGRPTDEAGPVQITRILPRTTTLARAMSDTDRQILAVNVDLAFLGTSLNDNFNLRRLERYLTLARDAGVRPVVLLTKRDLCEAPGALIDDARAVAGDGVPIHCVSVVTGEGMEAVRGYLKPGVTAVILGSSGIGKSTLVNHLAEADLMDMMEVREFDDKGRHCTTFRHLVRTPLPEMGGLLIDTPGLRGLTLGESADALAATFADIESLATTCKFTNCRHDSEPGCAIRAALEAGTLDAPRLEGYLRLQRQMAAAAQKENRVQDRKQKKIAKKLNATMEKKNQREWHDT